MWSIKILSTYALSAVQLKWGGIHVILNSLHFEVWVKWTETWKYIFFCSTLENKLLQSVIFWREKKSYYAEFLVWCQASLLGRVNQTLILGLIFTLLCECVIAERIVCTDEVCTLACSLSLPLQSSGKLWTQATRELEGIKRQVQWSEAADRTVMCSLDICHVSI